VLSILVLSGVILLPVLLPLSATDNAMKRQGAKAQTTSKGTFNQLDKLSMANITVRSVFFSNNIIVNRPFNQLISCVCQCRQRVQGCGDF